jgi:hypothetical protein
MLASLVTAFKVWQCKPSTGHDEEDNSPKANNLGKPATNTLRNSKRAANKKNPVHET